jgi:hypothetical protein
MERIIHQAGVGFKNSGPGVLPATTADIAIKYSYEYLCRRFSFVIRKMPKAIVDLKLL